MYDNGDRMSMIPKDRRLTLIKYQELAVETAIYPRAEALLYTVLGLNGEAGELAEKAKKMIRDDAGILTEERRRAMIKELGDVLWYVATTAKELGVSLEEVAKTNLNKLNSRKTRGKLKGSGDDR